MWNMWSDLALMIAAAIPVSLAVEALSEIISTSELFTWIKTPLGRLALPTNPALARWYWAYLHKLINCGYCTSVVVALVAALVMPGALVGTVPWDNLVVKWMLLHRLANWWHVSYSLHQKGRIVPQDLLITLLLKHDRVVMANQPATVTPTAGVDNAGAN